MVELIIALAIVAVLASLALPSLRQFVIQQRLKATARELLADMQLARSTALSMGFTPNYVNLTFSSDASTTCYSIAVVSSPFINCDCTRTSDVCQLPNGQGVTAPFRQVTIERSSGIAVSAPNTVSAPSTGMKFNSTGMTTDNADATLAVTASSGGTLHVMVGATGFPRLCVPTGTSISGVPPC